ncbi:hypothetical protein [Nonomuraea candida]|uniref:hypothetical protein n=1 Tax=Nonomuraea candida TaxID=359159 RepID=UPI0005BE83BB|nr:hypothetical protein [Nonomuraea candida]
MMIDLDIERDERLAAIAAERNAAVSDTFPLKFRGRVVCQLPTELPLDVLEPLTHVAVDLGLIVRTALDAARIKDPNAANMAVLDMVIDQLVINKQLPDQVMAAVKEMAVRLLGEQGFDDFFALRPALPDMVALVKGLGRAYGLRLGESSPSSGSSSGGTTSMPTLPTTTPDSIPEELGSVPASPASSESGGYSPERIASPLTPSST